MLRSTQGDDRPSIVVFCAYRLTAEELRKEYSPVVRDVLKKCNQLVIAHGARHSYLIEAYADLCRSLISTGDLQAADRALEPFRTAIEWRG